MDVYDEDVGDDVFYVRCGGQQLNADIVMSVTDELNSSLDHNIFRCIKYNDELIKYGVDRNCMGGSTMQSDAFLH